MLMAIRTQLSIAGIFEGDAGISQYRLLNQNFEDAYQANGCQ